MKRYVLPLLICLLALISCDSESDVSLRAVFINDDGEGVTTISLESEEEAVIRYEVKNSSNSQVDVSALRGEILPLDGDSVLYTAPETSDEMKDTVTVTSLADPEERITLVANISAGTGNTNVSVDITPASTTATSGEEVTFTANVTGLDDDDAQGVSWSGEGVAFKREGGETAIAIAPAEEGVYIIRATSQANSSKFAEATLTVENDATITLTPTDVTLLEEEQQSFTVDVSGVEDTRVSWRVSGGSLDVDGKTAIYTAPNADGTYILTVTSLADSDASAQATITVNDDGVSDVEVTVTPTVVNLGTTESQTFTARVTGTSNTTVTWDVSDGDIVVDGNTVTYTAPANPGTYTITATSEADPDVETSVDITVSAVEVSVSPSEVTLKPEETVALDATVTGANDDSVAWVAEQGSLSINGNTAVHRAAAQEGTYVVEAISNADGRRSARVVVTVEEDVQVRLEPSTLELGVGETTRIQAIVTGDPDTSVTWSSSAGTITGTGNEVDYRAPSEPGSYTITATSQVDTEKSATAVVTVSDITVQVSPASVTLAPGETQRFRATVNGAQDTTVRWEAAQGTLDVNGNEVNYTAPSNAGNYLLTATSNANSSIERSVTVTVE